MLSSDVTVALISLAGVAFSGLCGVAGILINNWYKSKWSPALERKNVMTGLAVMHRIYQRMEEIADTGAERVILFAGHNSGGVPRAHSPFWTTALHWVIKDKPTQISPSDYHGIPVDAEYIKMLLDAEADGEILLSTGKMTKCQLKTYYLAEGVTHSVIYYIGIKEHKFLYLSAAKFADEPFSQRELAMMRLKVQAIRNSVMSGIFK